MEFIHYVRYAVRTLARSPGYVAAFVLTLGLGIGANTAIFSVINGVLLEPLPFPDADRIMYVRQPAVQAGVPNARFSFAEVEDYRESVPSLDEFVEFGDWTFNVVGNGDPHIAVAGLVTPNYFRVMGMRPQLGRTLTPEDDMEGAEPVMVLTHEYWSRVFGEDEGVIGETVKLSGKVTTIVGVLEPGSHYTGSRRQEFYVNYASNDHYMGASMQDERTHRMTDVFARLGPGAPVEAARRDMDMVRSRLHNEYPEAYPGRLGMDVTVSPWQEELTKGARSTLILLLGTVVLVLITACANVANLTLTRMIRRDRELAIRSALGAGAGRLRAQILAENLVLALGGAALGLVLAVVGLDALVAYTGRFTIRTGEIDIDWMVLTFTVGIAVAVALLLAWIPGMRLSGDLGGSLGGAGGGRSTGGVGRRRVQRGLVVSQLAMSFALLIGASLLVRTLIRLTQVDPGFHVENVLTLDAPNMTQKSPEENLLIFQGLLRRLDEYPGVRSAAVASWAPLQEGVNSFPFEFEVEGREVEEGLTPQSDFNFVSHRYFETVGIPVLRGRAFAMADDEDSPRVAIINESMARALFRDDEALGRRVRWAFGNGAWQEWVQIVGVAADTRARGVAARDVPTLYQPWSQSFVGSTVIVRTTGTLGPLARFVTASMRELDPERPIARVHTMEELRAEDIAPQRLNAQLFGGFAVLALVIAAVGVLGVLAFSVSQRTQEFGVRMALGARKEQVLSMVLFEGAALALVGLIIGGLAATALARLLAGMLYEIEPTDPVSFAVGGALLVLVSVGAALLPARRATSVDPVRALKAE